MPALSFRELAAELQAAGAARHTIARILLELREHCADAEAACLARGLSPQDARAQARADLGTIESIVDAVAARRELLDWRHRWPQSAQCVDSIGRCLAVPVAPFNYCASHSSDLLRWGVSSGLGAVVTGSILLVLHSLVA